MESLSKTPSVSLFSYFKTCSKSFFFGWEMPFGVTLNLQIHCELNQESAETQEVEGTHEICHAELLGSNFPGPLRDAKVRVQLFRSIQRKTSFHKFYSFSFKVN